jgi:branched-chain amino acid transport system permease protein
MVANNVFERGVRFTRGSPGGAVVVALGILLAVDLLLKLGGVGVGPFGGSTPIGQFANFVWDGLVLGLIIGLAGIGLSLTYSILNFANFAHGEYLTAGAFSGWAITYIIAGLGGALKILETGAYLVTGMGSHSIEGVDMVALVLLRAGPGDVGANVWLSPIGVILGLAAAIVATILVALALDRVVYRPMRDADGISLLIGSIGVAFALRYFIALVFGQSGRIVTSQEGLPSVTYSGVIVDAHEVTLVVVAIALMLGLHFVLQQTKLGTAMRAMADNRSLAQVTGIPTERVIRSTWILGAGLTGAAGFLLVLSQSGLAFNDGWRLLLLIFAAVIMGGIGSIYGAIAGGLVIGLASKVSLVWLTGDLTSMARPTAFALMILILLFRPSGIFGGVKTA